MLRYIPLVPPTYAYCLEIADHLRPEEKAEVWAAEHETSREAILRSWHESFWCRVGLNEQENPIGIVGLSQLDNGWVSPWLLCTPDVVRLWRPFLRTCRRECEKIKQQYPRLINCIDVRYERSLAWAKWLGFTVDPPHSYGADKKQFCVIHEER